MKKIILIYSLIFFATTIAFSQTWKNYAYPEAHDSVFTKIKAELIDSTVWVEASVKLKYESGKVEYLDKRVFFKKPINGIKFIRCKKTTYGSALNRSFMLGDTLFYINNGEYKKTEVPVTTKKIIWFTSNNANTVWLRKRDTVYSYDGHDWAIFPTPIKNSINGTKYSSSTLLDEVEPLNKSSFGQLYGELHYENEGAYFASYVFAINWVLNLEKNELQTFSEGNFYFNENGMVQTIGDSILENSLNQSQFAITGYKELSIVEIDASKNVWLTGVNLVNDEKQLLEVNVDTLKVYPLSEKSFFFPEDSIYFDDFSEKTKTPVNYQDIQTLCYSELGGGNVEVVKMIGESPLLLNTTTNQLFTMDECGLGKEINNSWFLNNKGGVVQNNNDGALILNNDWEEVTTAYPQYFHYSNTELLVQDSRSVYWGLHNYTLKQLTAGDRTIGYQQLYMLISYKNNQWSLHKDVDSLTLDLLKDNQNIIWAIGHKQLLKYNGIAWESYSLPVSKAGTDNVYFTADKQGDIWVTQTDSENIYNFHKGTWQQFTFPKGRVITQKFIDPDGGFWVSYDGGAYEKDVFGIVRWHSGKKGLAYSLDGEEWTYYPEEEAMLSAGVNSMIADHNNNIWMGTDKGVMKLVRHAEITVGLEVSEKLNKIVLYPNPVTDMLQLQGIEQGTLVSIYSIDGQEVSVEQTNQTIDVSDLKSGIYIVKMQSSQQVQSKQFIKL